MLQKVGCASLWNLKKMKRKMKPYSLSIRWYSWLLKRSPCSALLYSTLSPFDLTTWKSCSGFETPAAAHTLQKFAPVLALPF